MMATNIFGGETCCDICLMYSHKRRARSPFYLSRQHFPCDDSFATK